MPCLDPKNFHEKYENFVHTETYEYGSYFQDINYPELIVEAADEKHLKQGLGNFFYSEHDESLPETNSRKRAFKKAEKLIKGRLNYGNFLSHYNGKEGLLEAVKKAVSLGYVTKFRIKEPWHASVFFDEDRIYTFPFQHKFIVLYTGQARHIFFSKLGKWDLLRDDKDVNDLYGVSTDEDLLMKISEDTGKSERKLWEEVEAEKDRLEVQYKSGVPQGAAVNELAIKYNALIDYRNPESVIKQGALYTGNQHVSDRVQEEYDRDNEKAVWLGFLDKAKKFPAWDEGTRQHKTHEKLYDESVVLEMETPTRWVAIKDTDSVDHGRIEGLNDSINEFGSPYSMAGNLSRDDEFVIPEETGRAPIYFLKSIWDREEFPGTPHFMSKERFIGLMEERFPNRMPGGETHIEGSQAKEKELKRQKNSSKNSKR